MDKKNKGMTLIELIVVIGLITIIAGVAIYALNPSRHFSSARNTQRWAHINAIMNAIYQRMTDNRGSWNSTCGTETIALPTASTTIGNDPSNVNLETCLVPTYLPEFPLDPSVGTATSTGYSIIKYASGRMKIFAPNAELDETISIIR